ncbi:MAG: FtsW/RodA/SpoVE family cell cycle protein, partial [Pseudomonadota bacterium]
MTEMVFGAAPLRESEPILPRWWRTIDRWTLGAVLVLFGIGILLGLAASPPLAARNELAPFHYVERQAVFGALSLTIMVVMSMMSPLTVRRLGVIGATLAFAGLLLLPVLGTDFGKGAVRWFSLGFASLQPSEFLKPGLVIVAAWLMAASQEINGPPGKSISFALVLAVVALLIWQPDFGQACLVLFAWGVMYFVAGASYMLLSVIAGLVAAAGVTAYSLSDHVARRIDGFLSADIDPRTQLGYATDAIREGGFFGVGVGGGQVKWSLPDAHT